MERLTKRELANVGGRELVICNHKKEDCNDSCMYESGCKWRHKALRKLKEYEDAEEKNIKTNGDMIRSMNDEQLAYLLASIKMPDEDMMIICGKDFFAEDEILDWLKEETEQELAKMEKEHE